MLWLVLLGVIALLLLYAWIVRPILNQQPLFSAAFKAEASAWQKAQAKLTGFRTKLAARLVAIAGIMVGLYDQVLPLVTGQDWTPLTAKVPAWSIPLGMVVIGYVFHKLREVTENPPHVILQKDDNGVPKVVAVEKPVVS
jgi:hypothetical protein